MAAPAPGTPTRQIKASAELDEYTINLSEKYGLQLEIFKPGDSPEKRQSRRRQNGDVLSEMAFHCPAMIKFLFYKNKSALDEAVKNFEEKAAVLQASWDCKPKAEIEPRRRSARFESVLSEFSKDQRRELLETLSSSLRAPYDKSTSSGSGAGTHPFTRAKSSVYLPTAPLNDTVDHTLFSATDKTTPTRTARNKTSKRESEGTLDLSLDFKKPKFPLYAGTPQLSTMTAAKSAESLMHATRILSDDEKPDLSRDIHLKSASLKTAQALENQSFSAKDIHSRNTSFTSVVSAIFSISSSKDTSFSEAATANTSFCEAKPISEQTRENLDKSLLAWGSSWDANDSDVSTAVETNPSNDLFANVPVPDTTTTFSGVSTELNRRLEGVFPKLPSCLRKASFRMRYEITRVFLHAHVPINNLHIETELLPTLDDYDSLWRFLMQQPELQGQSFPERSSHNAWVASKSNFCHGAFEGVVLSGAFRYSSSSEGPLFDVQLQPLKTDLSCRLKRQFGNDRFLEMVMPNLSSRKNPLLPTQTGSECRQAISKWLVRELHSFLGVDWSAFYVKDIKRQKKSVIELTKTEEPDEVGSKRLYFFAEDGIGYQNSKLRLSQGGQPAKHRKMRVIDMLNWLIPLDQNQNQTFLKLFSRIDLGVSKTYDTVILKESNIKVLENIYSDSGEVMNDGCGRMSKSLAANISKILRITPIPSGFQGRIGSAKGFWVVDDCDTTEKEWIELYRSQLKWDRGPKSMFGFTNDERHRTFEVLDWPKVLKSAAMNLQLLPILENRGGSSRAKKNVMRQAIARLLADGLTHEVSKQLVAMETPQSFRKWVHDIDNCISGRVKHQTIQFQASLPTSLTERMNMLLDAGFDPRELEFLKELAWKAHTNRCDVLRKKLNISVGCSTYAFMVPDFTGTLEPGEVHFGFSTSFNDEVSGFSGVLLAGQDVLVARAPVHYVSDIQKLRTVFKVELMAWKDVIVFSTKGDSPLAKLLSGGDYDGDKAWICWEPTIVQNFHNAKFPECPGLVTQGFLSQDTTTYATILLKHNTTLSSSANAVTEFLERGIEFNLNQNMLGYCTNFKEFHCYSVNDVEGQRAVFLSTLLSSLVDQSKQGYFLTDESWEKIKREVIVDVPREPNYKRSELDGKAHHIIDYLKFKVANATIEKTLINLHKNLPPTKCWDTDIVKLAEAAKKLAVTNPEWEALLKNLEEDISPIKNAWAASCGSKGDPDEFKAEFRNVLAELYPRWRNIKPHVDSPLTQALMVPGLVNSEHSTWELLKASVAFATYSKSYVSRFIWWMAGRQLCQLKTMYGRGMASVAPDMYAMLKPDATYVRLFQSEEERHVKFWEEMVDDQMRDVVSEDDD